MHALLPIILAASSGGRDPEETGVQAAAEFAKRPILHVDMDAFFAAIEQRDHPEWRGLPVVVGAPPDRRGVVSTASYEARRFGVHSAMPSRTAARLCPNAVFVPVDMARYRAVSARLMEILHSYTPQVEPASIDEAFLDVRGAYPHWPDPVVLARALKERIRDELGLTASVGVAPNKFLAKLASDLNKPDGLTATPWEPEAVRSFLAPLPVTRLWGVGPVTAGRLARLGIRRIGDLQRLDPRALSRRLGPAAARQLLALAAGEDPRTVAPERVEKSISHEITFEQDCTDPAVVRRRLIELAENVGARLRRAGKSARTGQLKLRYGDFHTITRRRTFPKPAAADRFLIRCALELLAREDLSRPVRLVGFGVLNLVPEPGMETAGPFQPELFEEGPRSGEHGAAGAADARLDQAVDRLRRQYGRNILRRGDWPSGVR